MATNHEPRVRTLIEKEAKAYLSKYEIQLGDPIMAPKRGECVAGNLLLTTNVFGVVMQPLTVYRYDVTITGFINRNDGTFTTTEFTKKVKGDTLFVSLRDRCRDVMETLQRMENGKFFKRRRCAYYDLQSILFSLDQLDAQELRDFTIDIGEMEKKVANMFGDMSHFVVQIRVASENSILTLGDLSTMSNNLLLFDRSLLQFLDVATSQYAMFSRDEHITFSSKSIYLLCPEKYNLDESAIFEDTCSYLAVGVQKAVHVIDGPAHSRAVSIVIQAKKTPFHGMVNLLQKVHAFLPNFRQMSDNDFGKLSAYLKGLSVETSHTKRPQRFTIRGLMRKGAAAHLIMVGDRQMTVEEYFKIKYNIQLKEPTLPLLETIGRDKSINYVPMELCSVSDNQRVNMNQQTPSMTQTTIRKCAIPPVALRKEIDKLANALHLWDSEWLDNALIRVVDRPLNVGARVIEPPKLDFASEQSAVDTRNYTWNGRRYLAGAMCTVWAAYAFLDPRDRMDNRQLEQFLAAFVAECNRRGLGIGPPAEWDVRDSRYVTIDETFQVAANNNCEFVFTVHSDSGDVHADIKYSERSYDLVSQCVRLRTVRDVMERGRRLTLSNIVNKTNIKLGGINYTLSNSIIAKETLGSESLYIGIGMNHPGGGLGIANMEPEANTTSTTPSVVGFAANVGANNEYDIAGDFVLQAPCRDEKANIIGDILERCLDYYQRGRKHLPQRVIIYRNGCSEGQYRTILQYEVPLMKYLLSQYGCDAKITIIVVNKLQTIRLFKKNINGRDKPSDQNIFPGVVVDHTVVHPIFNEFILNSHRALQGTARAPKYTVLYDDNEFTIDVLEAITYYLCYGHQIVFMPTSLPSPLYIANRYAERGRMLYQRWVEHDKHSDVNYHIVSNKLCFYNSKKLFGRRINA